jgi:hypothetical protein
VRFSTSSSGLGERGGMKSLQRPSGKAWVRRVGDAWDEGA